MVVAADIRKLVEEGEMTRRVLGSALDSAAEQILSLVEDPSFGEGGYAAHHSSAENEYSPHFSRGRSEQKAQRNVNLNLEFPAVIFN